MNEKSYSDVIAREVGLRPGQVQATIELLDEGNTLPFIARYRKEATGSLDEEQLRQVIGALERLRSLDERRATILAAIGEQGRLTPKLEQAINAAGTMTALEDLYQPYKQKRRTRASVAREKGLEPLAKLLIMQPQSGQTLEALASEYVKGDVADVESALAGARDIVAELLSEHAAIRGAVRDRVMKKGVLKVEKRPKAEDEKGVFELYYEFEKDVPRLLPHQTLAINRGEAGKVLRVKLIVEEIDWLLGVRRVFRPNHRSPFADQLQMAMDDGAKRLLLPAIERDVRRALTEKAEAHAIGVFAHNLQGLLNQPPLAGQTVLGIDPAFRTGCKVAVVDETGRVLDTMTIYPHSGKGKRDEAIKRLAMMLHKYAVSLIAIGNGTASRETEQFVAELIRTTKDLADVKYLMVNEAGASVYSASPLAKSELPDMDVTLRGAVSIARRVQDPLAELVKIDPKAIGVGLYQHDVNQKSLATALDGVVEMVVNRVGVDVNTASPALLTYVSGIGPKLAERMVAYRDEHGAFRNRTAFREVTGLGRKAYEQSAGFLRIREGDEPLDESAIHPESYHVARKVLQRAKVGADVDPAGRTSALKQLQQQTPLPELAVEFKTGVPTLEDILEQLIRPGRDPREDAPAPILRSDVLAMDDLRPGMRLKGTVRNVVDFGAFVDIGVKQNGLLHKSKMPKGTKLNVGDVIDVGIVKVDKERGRIGLEWQDD